MKQPQFVLYKLAWNKICTKFLREEKDYGKGQEVS